MKVDLKSVGKETAAGGDSGLGQIEGIIKGINTLFDNYWRLQGKTPPAKQLAAQTGPASKMSFSEARAIKKAEVAAQKGVSTMPDEFRELLTGLIKASKTLEGMGFSEKPIGQVILELPFTLSQSREFLEKLYKSRYNSGG